MSGKKEWFFPDAELPPRGGDGELFGHESIIVLNTGALPAQISLTLYYTDREPVTLPPFTVDAKRVRCVRAVEGEGLLGRPVKPGEQYAIRLSASQPVVAQYGRLDMRGGSMAFYTTPGYAE